MSFEEYSSRDVIVNWGGVTFVGLAPDTFITVTQNADMTDEEVGADGYVSISHSPDSTATIQIMLQQQSPTNSTLSKVARSQRQTRLAIKHPMSIYDRSGAIMMELNDVHMKSIAEQSAGSTATGSNNTWTFFASQAIPTPAPDGIRMSQDTLDRLLAETANTEQVLLDNRVGITNDAAIQGILNASTVG